MPRERNKSKTQVAAESEVESFRKDLGPFVVAAQDTRMPMVFTDGRAPHHRIVFANDSLLALTGFAREELLGERFHFLMSRGDDATAAAQVEAAFEDDPGNILDVRCRRRDGGDFWAAVFISPVRDDGGDVVQHFASFVNLTRRQEEHDHLQLLLDELNHRTQNTLATVQAIAAQTLRGAADRAVIEAFQGRIQALAKTHSLLGGENWSHADLREVIEHVLPPFGLNDERIAHFVVQGVDVRLPSKAALTLAMVFHELATNAVKHGALANGNVGRIDIAWQVAPAASGDRMRLRWTETCGPPVTPPGRAGFGTRLIAGGLAQELGGEVRLDYLRSGVVCEISMPLPPTAAA